MSNALAFLALVVGVCLLIWSLGPGGRRRSAAWREHSIKRHGPRGYVIRGMLWRWVPVAVIALIMVIFVRVFH